MNHLYLLQDNLNLLLQHTDEVLHTSPYYYSRIISRNNETAYKKLTSIPLGPYLEFWQQVPVNHAGKLLLTYDLFERVEWMGDKIRELFPGVDRKLPHEELIRESGFLERKPLPGISRHQLQDILYRYMLQCENKSLPLGAPFEFVIEELKEGRPQQDRASRLYAILEEELRAAITDITGTDRFCYVPFEKEETLGFYQAPYHPLQKPISFRMEQEKDMSLTLVIELAVPSNVPVRGLGLVLSGGAVALTDKLQHAFTLMDTALQQDGFTPVSSDVSLAAVGIAALYQRAVSSPEDLLNAAALGKLAALLQRLYQILEQEGLQA